MRRKQAGFRMVNWPAPPRALGDLDWTTGTRAQAVLSIMKGMVPVVSGSVIAFPVGRLCHPGPAWEPRQCEGVPFAFQELCRQQRSFQALDQECTQMRAKLTQELQQAKNTRNMLQAELDKVGAAHLLPACASCATAGPGRLQGGVCYPRGPFFSSRRAGGPVWVWFPVRAEDSE